MSSLAQQVPEGYQQTEVGLIPKAWGVKNIGDALSIRHGRDQKHVKCEDGLYPILGTGGEMGRTNTFLYDKPSVLIGRKGTINKPSYMDSPFWTVDTLFYSEVDKKYFAKFVYYKFCMIDWIAYNEASGVPSLNASTIESIQLSFPDNKKEQTAIANALSDVDALLTSLEKLIAKKRGIKTAAMQQLLTGKKRLPPFDQTHTGYKQTELGEIPQDWEVVQVSSVISDYFCGPSPTCEERNIHGGAEWGVLKTTCATLANGWDWKKHKLLPQAFWGRLDLELRVDDVIITKAGPRHRVGVAVTIDHIPSQIVPSGKMIAMRPITEKVDARMLSLTLMLTGSQYYLNQRTTGMAEAQLNFENADLFGTPIIVQGIEEQRAIAGVLTDMGAEIDTLEQRLNKTQQLKQGMMQELLTGKTRLVTKNN